MAINPNLKYPGRVTAPDANYTYASSKNESSPGAGDGTPYELARANDIFGLQQALLRSAGIVPSNNADTQLASEYLQGIVELASGRAFTYDDSGIADAYILDVRANQQAPAGLFDGQILQFQAANANAGGACTINAFGTGIKSVKTLAGADPVANDIPLNFTSKVQYDLANDWYEIITSVVLPDFTGANQSITANGYQKLPGGLIVQWGAGTATSGGTAASFPIAFPNGIFKAVLTHSGSSPGIVGELSYQATTSNITMYSVGAGPYAVSYIAIGY